MPSNQYAIARALHHRRMDNRIPPKFRVGQRYRVDYTGHDDITHGVVQAADYVFGKWGDPYRYRVRTEQGQDMWAVAGYGELLVKEY